MAINYGLCVKSKKCAVPDPRTVLVEHKIVALNSSFCGATIAARKPRLYLTCRRISAA